MDTNDIADQLYDSPDNDDPGIPDNPMATPDRGPGAKLYDAASTGRRQDTPAPGNDRTRNADQQARGQRQQAQDQDGRARDPNNRQDAGSVPEVYEFATPEGMQADTALAEAMTPALKELQMTQAQVDTLVNSYAAHQRAAYEDQVSSWADEVHSWPDSGEALGLAKAALATCADRDTREAFANDHAIGSNPRVIRLLADLARQAGLKPGSIASAKPVNMNRAATILFGRRATR